MIETGGHDALGLTVEVAVMEATCSGLLVGILELPCYWRFHLFIELEN
jgi:hypothetical protein